MENFIPLRFTDRTIWRQWLVENSARAHAVWLELARKDSDKTTLMLAEAVEEAICFGWIDGKLRSKDKEHFILRFSPRQPASVWSRINRERAEVLAAQGKMTPAGLATIEEAKKRGLWDAAYTNKTPDEIPPDLADALRENPKAAANFDRFANTYRNTYTGWIASAKTQATRKKRIEEVVRRAELNLKPGMP